MAAKKKATKKTSKKAAKAAGFVLQVDRGDIVTAFRKVQPSAGLACEACYVAGANWMLRKAKRAAASALAQRER